MQFRNFSEVVSRMENYTNLEKKTNQYNVRTYRLDRMQAILDLIGNPQKEYKTIHVAGSKGKGSTSSFIAAAIKALGYRTGLYMSPHVNDIRERFTVDGSFVPDEILIKTGNELFTKIENFTFDSRLGCECITTFELYTAFAFLLFKNTGCSWAVIETGLGGRLDATNVIMPEATVLTPVELEHTEILGNTISEIAAEKSKIIKNSVPVFISYQKKEALDVFLNEANENNSPVFSLDDCVKTLETKTTVKGQLTHIEFKDGFRTDLNLKLIGNVQAMNAALALLIIRQICLYKQGITEKAIEDVVLPGRMEKVDFARPLYIDGAHTQESIRNVINTFRALYPQGGICVFGCVLGKRYSQMCSLISDCFDTIIVCRPGTYKKSDVRQLYEELLSKNKDTGKTIELIPECKDAMNWIIQNSNEGTPVLVCGSFYLAGLIRESI